MSCQSIYRVGVYIHIYVLYTHMYVYVYIYTCIHMCIYIYMRMYTPVLVARAKKAYRPDFPESNPKGIRTVLAGTKMAGPQFPGI